MQAPAQVQWGVEPRGRAHRELAPPTIRAITYAGAAAVGVFAIVVIAGFVWTSTRLTEANERVIRDTHSMAVASQLELSLLTFQRLSNLRVLTADPSLHEASAEQRARVVELLHQADGYVQSREELERLRATERSVARYLDVRTTLEARGLDHAAIVRGTRYALDEALENLEAWRALNAAQVAAAHDYAQRIDRIAEAMGATVGGVLLLVLLATVLGAHLYLVRPSLRLHHAMRRFRAGEADARAGASGPRELRDLAVTFDEMADALARQREAQLSFLAGVAHDLRNPLAALKMAVHMARMEQTEAREHTLSLADRQVDRLGRMVEDLLDATRIEAGELELQRETFDVRDAAREIVSLYGPTSPSHDVRLTVPDQPVLMHGDALRVEQVLSNLLSNAIKFSPRGGRVDVRVGRDDGRALLEVADRGIGIPPEAIPDLFAPFRRRAPEVAAGAGLGLSVVRRIVTAHQGTIEVESEPHVGSTFRVRLPLAAPHEEAAANAPAASAGVRPA